MKHLFFLLIIFISCNTFLYSQNYKLVKKWETDSIFKVPESVLFNKANNTLYVSNIDGKDPWSADGKGSIGKMDADGKNITVDWITGLQAPKGMGLYKGRLYVADLKEVVVINIATATIENRIAVPDAQGLNDISIDNKGTIYVSDSKAKRVYRIKNGVSEIVLDSLKAPNGILTQGKKVYLLNDGGLFKINKNKSLTKIADGLEGGTDGVEIINKKDFLVSNWNGILYYVKAAGSKQLLLDSRNVKINSADIGFDSKSKTVFVPTFWRNSVVAYTVE